MAREKLPFCNPAATLKAKCWVLGRNNCKRLSGNWNNSGEGGAVLIFHLLTLHSFEFISEWMDGFKDSDKVDSYFKMPSLGCLDAGLF